MSQSSFGGLLDLMGFWRSESRISYSSGQQSDDDEQKAASHTHTGSNVPDHRRATLILDAVEAECTLKK